MVTRPIGLNLEFSGERQCANRIRHPHRMMLKEGSGFGRPRSERVKISCHIKYFISFS